MLQHDFQKIAYLQIFGLQIEVKERLDHNAQRHAHDILMKIAHLAALPLVEHLLGVGDHRVGIALDMLSPKGRRDKLSLPAPEVALGGQKAAPKQITELVEHRVLMKGVVFSRKDFLDISGFGEDLIWNGA